MSHPNKKLNILELIDDADIGGGQRHVLLLAEGLQQHGMNVTVACEPSGYLVNELNKRKISTLAIQLGNSLHPGQLLKLVRLMRSGQYDVLHTHGGTAGLWGRLAGYIAGVPVRIHTYHGIHSVYKKNSLVRWAFMSIERLLLMLTSRIICVSEGDFQLGKRNHLLREKNASVILNGVEVEKFAKSSGRQKIRKEFGIGKNELLVGTIARLHFQKGLVYLLEAIQLVSRQQPEIKFVVVGDGPQRELLNEKASKLGITSSVRFAGTRHDIPDLLSAFDLFVLPSLWEGLPLVLLEASAAGKAVIATAVDGTKELIHDGVNGLLVPPEHPRGLADAIQRAANDKKLRSALAKKAQEIARERYSVRHMVAQTMNLYIEESNTHGNR